MRELLAAAPRITADDRFDRLLFALAQHDLKRLLAYHSVENIGIILLGLALGSLGATYRQPVVAVLGFAGALLHTLNHGLFKSLLFLGAGVVVRAKGTREIDRLGGLARRIPRTALAFLVSGGALLMHEQNGWFYARSAFLHHLIGWTMITGAVFPLLRSFRPRAAALQTGFAVVFIVLSVSLYCDRDIAPVFGHLSPVAGAPHR